MLFAIHITGQIGKQRQTWYSSSDTTSIDSILICVGSIACNVQVSRVRVDPARRFVEVEVDGHTRRQTGAVVLTRRHAAVPVHAYTVVGVPVGGHRPARTS